MATSEASYLDRAKLFEKALLYLPGSYKLWFNYLKEAVTYTSNFHIKDPRMNVIVELFERSLVYMNKMPQIWLDYIVFLISLRRVTNTKRVFDRALKSIVISQHEKIWEYYLEWAESLRLQAVGVSVFNRYLKINPDAKDRYLAFLKQRNLIKEQARLLIQIIEDDMFSGEKTKFEYWINLFDLLANHPTETDFTAAECDAVMRMGINRFTDEIVAC